MHHIEACIEACKRLQFNDIYNILFANIFICTELLSSLWQNVFTLLESPSQNTPVMISRKNFAANAFGLTQTENKILGLKFSP
jgi:hypothetical protein